MDPPLLEEETLYTRTLELVDKMGVFFIFQHSIYLLFNYQFTIYLFIYLFIYSGSRVLFFFYKLNILEIFP